MIHGFDLNDALVCEGVVGDGCGGGRIFYIEDSTLKSFDPMSKESITLFKDIQNAIKISKRVCKISIECLNETIIFDLSLLKKV